MPQLAFVGSSSTDDELLLVRRASDSGWELPGGRLEPGENPVPGLRREIDEETGLDVAVDEPVHTVAWRNDAGRDRFGVYYCCSTTDREVSLSAEHTTAEWTRPGVARRRLSDPQARGVERVMERSVSTL
ncbi:nucleoside triphosphate pyrophosphohydrolase [Halolamina pelagica]|uniref:Nucleoside triphosphate pyrophosphohydrolase n=1 Tax=Halolamina pelagica TaxID=699431 RepID=A0A0P7GLA1_9EURY|nr:nucleoside triphosphate pyrophosphohydrolase [Halolamina pelagica]KPN32346.1 nucleoside triphosphate pyrophosphohydrolase [Halolamina pelagica]